MSPRLWAVWIVDDVDHLDGLFVKNKPVWRLWIRTEDGVLEPMWPCGPVLPNSLVDFLYTGDREEEEEEEEEENQDEFDFDDFRESVNESSE